MSFKNSFFKIVSASTLAAFLVTSVFPLNASAQMTPGLPVAGAIGLSESYQPAIVSGITIHPDNPLQFDFLIDSGDSRFQAEELKTEAQKMINYFMAAITVPDDEMWVNLSPYEKDRIIADGLSQTEMGRDMLAQDFLLKQLTASLMSPEGEEGKKFWEKIYSALGTTDVPIDTFNKVWIVPEQASVFVHDNNVFVVNSYLKVMLEEDYLGNGGRGMVDNSHNSPTNHQSPTTDVKSIIRQTILPIIEQEINQGKTFANLRQIYNSMILATWYKKNLRKSLLGEVYFDQNKVQGIDLAEKDAKEKIYNQYVAAFKSGVYDAIKEEYDPATQQIIPRKYFSGGLTKVPAVQEMNRASLSAPDVHADFAVLVDVQPSNTDKAMIDVRRAIKNLTGWRLELEDWASDFSDVNQLKFEAFLSGWLSPYDMASALAKQYTPGSFKKWDYGRDGSDTSFFIKAKLETFLSDRNILVSVVDHYLQADFLLKMRNQLMSSRKSVTDLLLDNGWFVMNEQVDEFLFLRRQLSSEERTANFIISDRTIREDSLEQLLSLYKQNKKMWLLYRLGNSDLFSPVILVSKEELIQFDHREIPIFPQGAIVNRRDDLVQAGNFSAIGFKYQPEINFFLSRSKGMKFEIEKINSDNTVEIVFKNNGLFLRIYNPLPLSNVQSVQEFSRKEKMVDKLLRLFDVSRNWLIVTQKWEDKINPARASVFQVVLDGLGKEMHVLDVRDVLARVIHLLHQLQSRYYEAHLKQYGGDPSKSFSNPLTIKLSKDEKHITYSFYQTPILDFFYADKKLEEIFEKDIRESDWNQISNYFNEEAIKGIEVRLYQMLLLTDGLRFVHNGQLWSIDNSGNLQPVKTDAAMMNVDDMYERYLFINSAGRIPQMIAAESVGDIFGESYFLRTMLGEIPESTIFDRLNAAIYVIENDGFYDEETQFAKKYLLEMMRGYGAGATNSGRLIAARYLHGHFPDEIDAQAEQLIEQAIRGTLFNISVFDRIMAAVYAYQNNLKIFIDTEEVEIFLTNLYQKANISLHERLIAAIYISEYDFDEGESYDFIFSVLKGEIKATNNDRVLAAIHVGIYGEEEDETYADGFLSAVRDGQHENIEMFYQVLAAQYWSEYGDEETIAGADEFLADIIADKVPGATLLDRLNAAVYLKGFDLEAEIFLKDFISEVVQPYEVQSIEDLLKVARHNFFPVEEVGVDDQMLRSIVLYRYYGKPKLALNRIFREIGETFGVSIYDNKAGGVAYIRYHKKFDQLFGKNSEASLKRLSAAIYEWLVNEKVLWGADAAMMEETPGGIDFDSAQMNLQESGEKMDFDFSNIDIDPAQMQNLRGLKPVIINIIPVTPAMLNRLLGKSETQEPSEDQQAQNRPWFIKAEDLLV